MEKHHIPLMQVDRLALRKQRLIRRVIRTQEIQVIQLCARNIKAMRTGNELQATIGRNLIAQGQPYANQIRLGK
ncbi:hypothetical protein D3C81_2029820 [compost metagenome]